MAEAAAGVERWDWLKMAVFTTVSDRFGCFGRCGMDRPSVAGNFAFAEVPVFH
jgi:hypothetical protein